MTDEKPREESQEPVWKAIRTYSFRVSAGKGSDPKSLYSDICSPSSGLYGDVIQIGDSYIFLGTDKEFDILNKRLDRYNISMESVTVLDDDPDRSGVKYITKSVKPKYPITVQLGMRIGRPRNLDKNRGRPETITMLIYEEGDVEKLERDIYRLCSPEERIKYKAIITGGEKDTCAYSTKAQKPRAVMTKIRKNLPRHLRKKKKSGKKKQL